MPHLTNILIAVAVAALVVAAFGKVPGSLRVLMLTAFVDMIGVLMLAPLLPFYAKSMGANAKMLAVIMGAFSAAQLLSAPFWGRVSDRYGRKPALLVGLFSSLASYVIFAYADSIWMLLLSRLVGGAGGGTVGVIQAYVSDAMGPKDRAKGLGWLSAATNAGVTLGPLIGSATTQMGRHAPGLLAAGLCLVNAVFVTVALRETHGEAARNKAKSARSPREVVWRTLTHPGEAPSRLIWIYSITIGAFYGVMVSGVLTLFLIMRYGATPQTIGFFISYNGVLNVVFRALLLGRVIDRFGEARTNQLGIGVLAAGLFLLPLTHSIPMYGIVAALLPLGATFTFPAVTAMLSQVVGDYERGVYMGAQQTFGGIVRVSFPLVAASAWDMFVDQRAAHPIPQIAFWISAAVVAAMLALTGRFPLPARTGEHQVPKAPDGAEGLTGAAPAAAEKISSGTGGRAG